MPPRLPPSLRATRPHSRDSYVCPECVRKASRGPLFGRTVRRYVEPATRSATIPLTRALPNRSVVYDKPTRKSSYATVSLASATAINAPSSVPPAHRQLHRQLLALQETAGSYTDLSRIQLAVRGLESVQPVIRVALLGLGANGALAARKLARVLLSDPLADEQAWERTLLSSVSDGLSLLLRYGDVEDNVRSSEVVRTMHIPSPFLHRNNVEILVTALNPGAGDSTQIERTELDEILLVPSLTNMASAGGRVGFVRFPVHKAVIVAEGVTGAVEYGRFPSYLAESGLVNAALSIPLRSSSGARTGEETATENAVDIDLALGALDLLRASNANGAEFSTQWQVSRVSNIIDWIVGAGKIGHKDAVYNLISSTLGNASNAVASSETRETAIVAANTVSDLKRSSVEAAISEWSSEAHRDLQSNLSSAIASPLWRRTAWWRLFWRVDDVSISTSDMLRQNWLTEAEQTLAYLSGRITEAGLASGDELRRKGSSPAVEASGDGSIEADPDKKVSAKTLAEFLQTPALFADVQKRTGVNMFFDPPWPQTINLSRQYLIHKVVPDLHIRAQALLFTSLSTISASVALGAWFYVATAGLGLYESGAIFALGTVWSLRRLQKRWSQERDDFASALREDGRKVLVDVETQLRRLVQDGGRVDVRPEDTKSWQDARLAIQKCREELERLRQRR